MERAADDGVTRRVVLVDDALLGLQRFGRRAADVRERVLEGDTGGDGAPSVQQRGEVAVLLLLQAEEARVAHRHRGRAGQESDQLGVLVGDGAVLSLLGEHQAADDSEAPEPQRDGQLLQLAPHLHRCLIGRVETGVANPEDAGPGALDDGHIAGTVVDAQAGADPGQVGRSEVARPDGRGGEGARGGVVLVEVAAPHVQRLGDEARDDGGGVVAGERPGDVRAGLDRQAQALAPRRRTHAPDLGSARCGYLPGAGTPATISSKHGNKQTPQPSRPRRVTVAYQTVTPCRAIRSRTVRCCRYLHRYPLQRAGAAPWPLRPLCLRGPPERRPHLPPQTASPVMRTGTVRATVAAARGAVLRLPGA